MPSLEIDSFTRLRIAKAILDTIGKTMAVRVISLPAGDTLLMVRRLDQVSFDLIADGQDLFNPHLLADVTALVEADLKANSDWPGVMTGLPPVDE